MFGQLLPGGGVGPALFAVPLAGGAPTQINSQSSYYFVDVESRDVFSWEQSAATATVGKLSLWSRTRAIPLAATSVVGLTSASADGSELAFTENVTATQLDVALLAGDAGSRVVLSGVSEAACSTRWAFARSTLVVQHCDAPVPDGGAPGGQPATLSAFNGGGTRVDLATLAPVPPASRVGWGAWDVAPDGSFLYASVNGASPTATLIAVPSGAKTLVDSEGEEGFVTADGAAVVYRSGKALHRAATGAPSPIVLATAGNATGLLGWSLDGGAVAYFDQWTKDVDGNLLTDLAVSTTAASGSVARQIVTGATTFFLGFTADASHVLYTSAIDLSTGLYTLAASPVAGGSAPRVLGADVLQFWSGSGSKVLFADNCNKSAQVCDVHAVDLATGAAPALIASPANASLANAFAVTPDATEVVFATNVGAPGSFGVPGLYVIPVP